jgi:hypothetical protein
VATLWEPAHANIIRHKYCWQAHTRVGERGQVVKVRVYTAFKVCWKLKVAHCIGDQVLALLVAATSGAQVADEQRHVAHHGRIECSTQYLRAPAKERF